MTISRRALAALLAVPALLPARPQFQAFVAAEVARWAPIVRASGAQAD